MKLVLPDHSKVRIIYSYLLLKAIEVKTGIVSYEDVSEAIAVAGINPSKPTIKKYLLILTSNNPPLLRFHSAGVFSSYFRVFAYIADDGVIKQIPIKDAERFKHDLVFALCHEETENTVTYAEFLKEQMAKEAD